MNSKQLEEKLQKLEARHIALEEKIAATKAELLTKIDEEKEVVPWNKIKREVLRLKVQGLSNRDAAVQMDIGLDKTARAIRQELHDFILGDGQDYTPEEVAWLEKKATLEVKREVASNIKYSAWSISSSFQYLPYDVLRYPPLEKPPEEVREMKKEVRQKLIILRKKLEKINHPDFPPEAIKIPDVD